jgi:hypothetical protein
VTAPKPNNLSFSAIWRRESPWRRQLATPCRIDGRFLLVRGELHEYHIHIGSGNVLMEPGSRYLCVVLGSGDTAANLPLPFEGDRILGVVLSKALLLVNDTQIKDPTIAQQLSQISRPRLKSSKWVLCAEPRRTHRRRRPRLQERRIIPV